MAFVLAVITVIAGVFGTRILRTWRRFGSIVPAIGGFLLLVSGSYFVYYWLTIGRALFF